MIIVEKVYIGYVSGVHGLRGDLKIKCKFESPDRVFNKGNTLYLNEEPHIITNSKLYKGVYLVTIDNLKDINLVEKYKGFDVFFDRSDLHLNDNEYILNDLYGLTIKCSGKEYGKVKEILDNGQYKILNVDYKKDYMIPLVDEYIERVDLLNKEIITKDIESLIL